MYLLSSDEDEWPAEANADDNFQAQWNSTTTAARGNQPAGAAAGSSKSTVLAEDDHHITSTSNNIMIMDSHNIQFRHLQSHPAY